ncbi:SDR family oxidoreductase [Litoribacter alkaliphilus]|uniref:SDR family oxidoreductase n=1 Tax=Litoribacter ruber TaxID=702568 RepID=A0AAP2CFV2_9BACT|nr:SDR family oxidoreductase [Litoribacter alkaliphilus]MBS9522789.1 SDR family oxidoreductase [Litoribacter alkaliphilus]
MIQLFNLNSKNILITGATGVLGKSIAQYLQKQGANVFLLGRNEQKLQLVKKEMTGSGKAEVLQADVTKEEDLRQAVEKLKGMTDRLDVMINMAGGNMPGAVIGPEQTLEDLSSDAVDKVMKLNYQGTLLPIKIFLSLLNSGQLASIINVSSVAADRPLTRVLGYAAAKAGIENLTKWLAVELAQKYGAHLRVNAVAPGFFLTEQNRNLLTINEKELSPRGEQILAHTPMARFGEPDDLHGAFHWLSSDASKFVTGTVVSVDGGFKAYSGV